MYKTTIVKIFHSDLVYLEVGGVHCLQNRGHNKRTKNILRISYSQTFKICASVSLRGASFIDPWQCRRINVMGEKVLLRSLHPQYPSNS